MRCCGLNFRGCRLLHRGCRCKVGDTDRRAAVAVWACAVYARVGHVVVLRFEICHFDLRFELFEAAPVPGSQHLGSSLGGREN